LQLAKPWDKILPFGPREPGPEVDKIIFQAAETLRIVGILLQPYMPNKAKLLLDQLGVDESKRTLEFCSVGLDLDYGEPMVELGGGYVGALFPPLESGE
jgi:methionyl-tRNA synthetase